MKLARTFKPFLILAFSLSYASHFCTTHRCLCVGVMKCTGLCLLALGLLLLSRIFDPDGMHSELLKSRKEDVGVARDNRGSLL